MIIYNPDGGQVEMCGNGVRCAAKYMKSRKRISGMNVSFETAGGGIDCRLEGSRVRVDMGKPRFEPKDIPVRADAPVIDGRINVAGRTRLATCLSMGNPHCVIFVNDVKSYPVGKEGPDIEHDLKVFPKRTNVEFARVMGRGRIETRVWERGAGETLACGTGACAVGVAAAVTGRAGRKSTVVLPGGELSIEWAPDHRVYMTGPAEEIFTGSIDI